MGSEVDQLLFSLEREIEKTLKDFEGELRAEWGNVGFNEILTQTQSKGFLKTLRLFFEKNQSFFQEKGVLGTCEAFNTIDQYGQALRTILFEDLGYFIHSLEEDALSLYEKADLHLFLKELYQEIITQGGSKVFFPLKQINPNL